jgi:hypothetical protein
MPSSHETRTDVESWLSREQERTASGGARVDGVLTINRRVTGDDHVDSPCGAQGAASSVRHLAATKGAHHASAERRALAGEGHEIVRGVLAAAARSRWFAMVATSSFFVGTRVAARGTRLRACRRYVPARGTVLGLMRARSDRMCPFGQEVGLRH